MHGTAVLVGAQGLLVRGPSGAGKSALAAALIARGGRLVADDRVHLSRCHGRIVAAGAAVTAGLLELRGRGLVAMAHERSAIIRLVVDIVADATLPRLPDTAEMVTQLLGVALPRQPAPAAPDRAIPLVAAALTALSPHRTMTLRLPAV